ncbi:MAG: NAD(P)H-hydrate dehydratase, partial [Burkholderiaceae bacterium]
MSDAVRLDADALRDWPLPSPSDDGDKEERGRVLIVGGSPETPGALLLAAVAALRAGAGKLALAAGDSIARQVAIRVPEARVIGLPETIEGDIAPSAATPLQSMRGRVDALLVGPGMRDTVATVSLVRRLVDDFPDAALLLDAGAMGVVRQSGWRFPRPVLLTPHAGEMAHLTGANKDELLADQGRVARDAAQRWNAVVAFKGATTWIASPDGALRCHPGGCAGMATSGSGDTLAGIVSGLAARGAPLEQACAWGVVLHAMAGERLSEQVGPVGFLAREIPDQIPALMAMLC